jgi:hypothetical protein
MWDIFGKERKKQERKQALIIAATAFLNDIKQSGALRPVATPLLLDSGEYAFVADHAKLIETRAVRKSTGGGLGLRVAKGVYLGRSAGQSESHQEYRLIDEGTLTLTNKRLIFSGSKENRTIPLSKLVSIKNLLDGFEVGVDGKAKGSTFTVPNAYIWSAALHILRAVKDPLNLGDMKIDIEFN